MSQHIETNSNGGNDKQHPKNRSVWNTGLSMPAVDQPPKEKPKFIEGTWLPRFNAKDLESIGSVPAPVGERFPPGSWLPRATFLAADQSKKQKPS
jgi:hypothetical protein